MDIEFRRGNTHFIRITPLLNGSPYVLSGDDEMRLTVKPLLKNCIMIEKIVRANGENVICFLPEDTVKIPPGKYRYDCGINIGGQFHTFIKQADFVLLPIVTEPFGDLTDTSGADPPEISGNIEIPTEINGSCHCNLKPMTAEEITNIFNSNLGVENNG
jgi:hypothetical protein